MYNRYIPQSNGIYRKHTIEIPDQAPKNSYRITEEKHTEPCAPKAAPSTVRENWDLGDLLLLCIVILLLLESEEDTIPILIAIAAFLFTQ